MEPQTSQPRITDYVRPLMSRWWLILLAVVVATGGVYAYYARKPNQYTTSTLVFVQNPGDPVTGLPTPASTDRTVENEASLLYNRATAALVAREIGYHGSAQSLLSTVSITSKPGEDFVQVTAQAGDPQQAANIANGFAQELSTSLIGAYKTRIGKAIQETQAQLAQTPTGAAGIVERSALTDQLDRLQLALHIPTQIAQQVNPALAPASPSSPKPVRNALFALVLALVGAIAVAYGLERFDRRLKNPDEMEAAYGKPLLAVLPHTTDPAPKRDGEPILGPDFREPFRLLRTNVELASVDAPPRTIVVSSAMPGEGKSTVVRNLALALRESGRRVAVVDLDLRHPALARMFDVPVDRGFTDVLRHEAFLEEVTIPLGAGLPAFDELVVSASSISGPNPSTNGHNGSSSPSPHVGLILSGAPPANPPGVLASDRVVEVLNELADHYDVVLIDSAPILAVTDTVPLLRYADAAVFVGRLDITTRDTAKRLSEFLERVPDVNVLGIVANDLSRLEAGSYGAGYGYYGYGGADAKTRRGRVRRNRAADQPKQPV
jgi:polysaccharide biosynthesis transport protein